MAKREMKKVSEGFVPVGRRTRLQRGIREKELIERNKMGRVAARSKYRKMNAEKSNQNHRGEDADDESDGEDIKIVDESEYLRHKAISEGREFSANVCVGVEEDSEASVQLVGERWDPLGVGIDDDDEDQDAEKPHAYEESGESGSGSEHCGVVESDTESATSSEEDNDDNLTDEEFRVDEDEMCGYTSSESSEEDGECKKRSRKNHIYHDSVDNHVHRSSNRLKKIKESTVDEEIPRTDDDEEQYLQRLFKKCERSSNDQGESLENSCVGEGSEPESDPEPEDFATPENGGNEKRDILQKKWNDVVRVSEIENKPVNLGSTEHDSEKKNDRLPKNKDVDYVVIESETEDVTQPVHFGYCKTPESDPEPEKFASSKNGGNGNSDSLQEKLNNVVRGSGTKNKPVNFGGTENDSEKKSDRPPKKKDMDYVVIESETEDEPQAGNFGCCKTNSFIHSSSLPHPPGFEKDGCDRGAGRLPSNRYLGIESEPENFGSSDNGGKRKRGRPPKNRNVEIKSTPKMKKPPRRLKSNEVENIMLNSILENGNALLDSCMPSVAVSEASTSLPLKFRYDVGNSRPVNSEEVQDSERLFQDLKFALRTCDIGAETSFMDENDVVPPCDSGHSAVLQEKLCQEGKHCLILDDEIGVRCKYCSVLQLEIRHVTPDFNKNIFGRARNWNYGRFPYDNGRPSDAHLPEFHDTLQNAPSNRVQGTVWELIPGVRETLYPHQQEGFEFMWRNIAGGIKLDELGKPTKFGSGGCIICHARGTGKTRLAITFLQSFIRKYPMSKPMIIAPKSMLLTWEEEFVRWNIGVPFINMNKSELTGNEDPEVLKYAEDVRHQKTIRIAKLYTWAKGRGILGISYTLFEMLAGDRKNVDSKIRRTLLEQSGIMVLDEGHTARNDQSNIWNVLSEVETKRRIILSGTPFQNNFEELLNTLSLVREEFGNPLLSGNLMNYGLKKNMSERRGLMGYNAENDRKIVKLKNRMKPFVHVHKGEILKKTLRGLFHSVLFLKPSDLQKACFQHLSGMKNGLKLDHLISIASVHPSLLYSCKDIPLFFKDELKAHRRNLDAGVKIRFLFDLITLAEGEKVLVFSQYLTPLRFIKNLLKSRYNWTEERELLYMDGKQDAKQRQAFIRHFNNPRSEARVLLASTKACREGIHLVGASRVVLLDVVWNPSVERQAISRAYRLGQKKDVFVYHLISLGTQEEDKYYRQVTKDRVSEKVFSSQEESSKFVRTLPQVTEDRILEEMIQNVKLKSMFGKIIYQPKADEFIESFGTANL